MAGMSISTSPKIHIHPFFVVYIVKVLKNIPGLHLSLSLALVFSPSISS